MNVFMKAAGDKFSQQQLTAEQISPNGSEVHGLYLLKSPKIDVTGLPGFSKPPKIPNF